MSDIATNLESVDTADLVAELGRRSRVFFVCMRPLADDPDHYWSRSWYVDGKPLGDGRGENLERVMGLIERAKFDLLYVLPTLNDIV